MKTIFILNILLFIIFKVYFIDYFITVVPFFCTLYSLPPFTLLPLAFPPTQFMSMGHTFKFFDFSISYTILNLPLSILYLPVTLFIPCTFPLFLLNPAPADTPPCVLHFCGSVPVLAVGFVFVFVFVLGSVVDCHFTVHSFGLLLFLR